MQDNLQVTMDEFLPLRDVVFNTLRQAILTGELKPGERLMEIHLANKLGVSRTPIREAIRKLELEGLVTMIPRRGAEVAQITEKSMNDVLEVRKILEEEGRPDIRIIAKIESGDGVRNIDSILHVADGIMVARGDMGVEIPFEEIPQIQKMLIKKGYNANKQVITATQMLESMIKNPRPTRAETTDVANAIYDGTSAIMLSGETAAGLHPVEAVRTMALIAETTEKAIDYKKRFYKLENPDVVNVSTAISHATVSAAMDLGATAIITVTKTGTTARMLSRYRPECPIISCTTSETTLRQQALSWGVIPLMAEERMTSTDDLIHHAVQKAVEADLLKNGDLVVITAGVPLGVSGTTNLMKVHITCYRLRSYLRNRYSHRMRMQGRS